MAITNADRASDLHLLDLNFRYFTEDGVSFQMPGLSKTRRSGPPREVLYRKFDEHQNICPVLTIREYEKRTSELRKPTPEKDPLFIAITKPHKPVVSSTISRWMKNMMAEAGIDISQFKAHSTRAAATSAAAKVGVPIKDILKTANWSRESTFQRFYHKPLEESSFATAIIGT